MKSLVHRVVAALRALFAKTPPRLAKVIRLRRVIEPTHAEIIAKLHQLDAELMELERKGLLTKPHHLHLVPQAEEVLRGR